MKGFKTQGGRSLAKTMKALYTNYKASKVEKKKVTRKGSK